MRQFNAAILISSILSFAVGGTVRADAGECSPEIKKHILDYFDKKMLSEDLARIFSFNQKLEPVGGITLTSCQTTAIAGLTYWTDDDPKKRPRKEAFLVAGTITASLLGNSSGFLRSFVVDLTYNLQKMPVLRVLRDTGAHQPECGANAYSYEVGPFVKIGTGCYFILAETRRRQGCAGQEAVDNTFVDFLNIDEQYQSGLQFEARRWVGFRKDTPIFKAQDVFDIKKCAVPQTARNCYEEIEGCPALPFSRDSAISPIAKGIIRVVPDTGSLEVAGDVGSVVKKVKKK
jgi:hypothetical protein